LESDNPSGADGWSEITGLIEAPATGGRIVFMACALLEANELDRCEFADAELVAMP